MNDGSFQTTLNSKMEVYYYLLEICNKDQFYILQNINHLNNEYDTLEKVFITLQRKDPFNWYISSIMEENSNLNHIKIAKKLHNISLSIAKLLEPSIPKCLTIVVKIGIAKNTLWILDIEPHFSKSKWSQHQVLSSIQEISTHIPNTQLVTPSVLFHFIQTYKQVILKPCLGQCGIGVFQISLLSDDVYEIHLERKKFMLTGKEELINYLTTLYLSKKRYLVQEKVPLATIDDCIFDCRMMIQRENQMDNWEVTATVAKVAIKNYIVSNVAKSVLPLEEAMLISSINTLPEAFFEKLNSIGLKIATYIGNNFPEVYRIGIDIGIDQNADIWIIEANLKPDINLFKRLKDKSVYEKIKNKKKW